VLKVYDRRERAEHVHAWLRGLSQRGAAVVGPVFCAPAPGVLALEDLGDRTVLDLLAGGGVASVLRCCTAWLDGYQRLVPAEPVAFDPHSVTAPLRRAVERLPEGKRARGAAARTAVRRGLKPYAGRPLRRAEPFGDLKPENLALCPRTGRVVGIDGNPDQGPMPREYEMATLLNWARLHRLNRVGRLPLPRPPAGWLRMRDAALRRREEAALLSGLGTRAEPDGADGGPDIELVRAFADLLLLRTWLRRVGAGWDRRRSARLEACLAGGEGA
jgi:hypothetical protein